MDKSWVAYTLRGGPGGQGFPSTVHHRDPGGAFEKTYPLFWKARDVCRNPPVGSSPPGLHEDLSLNVHSLLQELTNEPPAAPLPVSLGTLALGRRVAPLAPQPWWQR